MHGEGAWKKMKILMERSEVCIDLSFISERCSLLMHVVQPCSMRFVGLDWCGNEIDSVDATLETTPPPETPPLETPTPETPPLRTQGRRPPDSYQPQGS